MWTMKYTKRQRQHIARNSRALIVRYRSEDRRWRGQATYREALRLKVLKQDCKP